MKKKDEELLPLAMPVPETMERQSPSQILVPQEQDQNAAVSLVTSSCGVEGIQMRVGWSGSKYGVFTLHPNSHGVPMRLHSNKKTPAVCAKFVGRRLILYEGPSKNGKILATLARGNGCCENVPSKLTTPTGRTIGGIAMLESSCTSTCEVSGAAGESLYRVVGDSWCSNNSGLTIWESNTDTVIGRVDTKREELCSCSGPSFSVSYPQEMPLDHKLLLIVCMNLLQYLSDTRS